MGLPVPPAFATLDTARLLTPALLVDGAALAANIRNVAGWAARRSVALRPHVKTHKSTALARLQVEAGALGIACATLDEAQAMADAGLPDILVTAPVSSPAQAAALDRLRRTVPRLSVVMDHPDHAARLAALPPGPQVSVLIDVDIGHRRTGARTPQAAVAAARAAAATPGLAVVGVQGFGGHIQHIEDPLARQDAAREGIVRLHAACAALEADGHAIAVRSGSGTGAFELDADLDAFTEYQVGSYLLLDVDYAVVRAALPATALAPALFVVATVISLPGDGTVIVDAGTKALGAGSHATRIWGAPDARFEICGDEHGRVVLGPDGAAPRIGDPVFLVPPHCDPTVNLYSHLLLVDGADARLVPVDARRGSPLL